MTRIPCPTIYPERKTWYRGTPEDQPVVTHNVPCEGALYPCEICKAVRYCSREAMCLDGDKPEHVVRRRFCIDEETYGFDGGVPGWTRGERWNGWECPRFEKAEALAIIAAIKEQGAVVAYDAEADVIRYRLEGAEDEDTEVPAFQMETAEGVKTVYALGAWSWIWSEYEPYDAD
jgi:hypothetical protein